jgi:ATP-dependent DNA helicase RecG
MAIQSPEELTLTLSDLRQAMAYERKHRYINVQGKKHLFADFAHKTTEALSRSRMLALLLGSRDNTPAETLAPIIARLSQYAFAELSSRISTLDMLEAVLDRWAGQEAPSSAPRQQASLSPIAHPQSPTPSANPLERPIGQQRGIGPRLAQLLQSVGVFTLENLLYYFPRRYLDYNNRVRIKDLKDGEEVTVIATVQAVSAHNAKNRPMAIVSLTVADGAGPASTLTATWFYGKSHPAVLETYKSRFAKGAEVMLSGKVKWDSFKNRAGMDRPVVEVLSYQDAHAAYSTTAEPSPQGRGQGEGKTPENNASLDVGRIVPVYPLTDGLNLRFLRKAIDQALTDHLPQLVDPLPTAIKTQYQLDDLPVALRQIHFPSTMPQADSARRRLVFDELFYLQARLAMLRAQYKQTAHGMSLSAVSGGYVDRFLEALPFTLTNAQQRVFAEIMADLATPEPMYRMLQGDVGSGKTIVALLALLVGADNGYQGAMMAPTEILAEQHYRKFVEWLTPLGLRVGLFVGKAGAKERRDLRQALLNGQIHVAVGTHALIQDDVEFQRLGVVVVDEQHRFGVRQRMQLKAKGEAPEMLTMTATPIPRSLAMTLHGDLDVSVLDELPPGRQPIKTQLLPVSREHHVHGLIRQEIVKGRQVYIVFPLIEESETLAAKAATTEMERLQHEVFAEFRIGLLHGKLKPEDKDGVMTAFSNHQLDILVATTVVEVGVDVPNATVMVITNADRFGLAQLHQLRGRVGRGRHQSYCLLLCDNKTPETLERLNVLVESEDGFYLAEKDLELRGPGEFLGTRQSGLPDFILADIVKDKAVLAMAREAAQAMVADPAYLPNHPHLAATIQHKTEQTFGVLGAG